MSRLFETSGIKSMKLKNRIVRSATLEGLAGDNGLPTEKHFKFYENLARGGTGLIITGLSYVSRDGRVSPVGMLGVDRDEVVPHFKKLVKHVHESGARIAMQIAHAGRQTHKKAIGTDPIAPSPVMDKSTGKTPREMTEGDIERVINSFALAAGRVKKCGFDAVQLHGAHGYLINQFLNPHTNRRTDKWGGSLENRFRFLSEIYRRSREIVGPRYPILIKISAYDKMKNGIKTEEGVLMAEMMDRMGIDGIEVSCGIGEDGMSTMRGNFPMDILIDDLGMFRKQPLMRFMMKRFGKFFMRPLPFSQEYNLDAAREIKKRVKAPVFLVGGVIDPQRMEEIIEKGDADYISLSRALIREPGFPERIKNGSMEPSKCIHCNHCILYLALAPLRCYNGKRISGR